MLLTRARRPRLLLADLTTEPRPLRLLCLRLILGPDDAQPGQHPLALFPGTDRCEIRDRHVAEHRWVGKFLWHQQEIDIRDLALAYQVIGPRDTLHFGQRIELACSFHLRREVRAIQHRDLTISQSFADHPRIVRGIWDLDVGPVLIGPAAVENDAYAGAVSRTLSRETLRSGRLFNPAPGFK